MSSTATTSSRGFRIMEEYESRNYLDEGQKQVITSLQEFCSELPLPDNVFTCSISFVSLIIIIFIIIINLFRYLEIYWSYTHEHVQFLPLHLLIHLSFAHFL